VMVNFCKTWWQGKRWFR